MSESTRPTRVVVGGDRLASSQPTPAAPMLGRMADGQAVEWVTWPEAAAIVGCPVPTIDWYTRTGRIQRRPRHGARPSLSRSSVEEFARWWHHVQTARADRRVTRRTRKPAGPRPGPEARESQPDGLPPPPDSRTWIPTARAAELLDVSPATVARLAKQGNYPALLHAGRWWVDGQAVVASAEDRSRWVSYVEAARLAGCSTGAIGYAVRHGGITQREVTNRALPSLERSSVPCPPWSAHPCSGSPRAGQPGRVHWRGPGCPTPRETLALLTTVTSGSTPRRPPWSWASAGREWGSSPGVAGCPARRWLGVGGFGAATLNAPPRPECS